MSQHLLKHGDTHERHPTGIRRCHVPRPFLEICEISGYVWNKARDKRFYYMLQYLSGPAHTLRKSVGTNKKPLQR